MYTTKYNLCVLLNMLQALCDFKHLNNKYYDDLLQKVKIDQYVNKIGLLEI